MTEYSVNTLLRKKKEKYNSPGAHPVEMCCTRLWMSLRFFVDMARPVFSVRM
jgi:hypothetical protein